MENASSTSLTSLDRRLVEGFVLLFAVWTVCSNLAAFAGISLNGLLLLFPCAACFSLAALLLLRKPFAARTAEAAPAPSAAQGPELETHPRYWGFLACGAALVLIFFATHNFKIFWWGSTASFAAACWLSRKNPPGAPVASETKAVLLLWMVALLMAGLVLAGHRSDTDDMNYVGTAVWFADHPQQAIFGSDSMYPLEKLPYLFPPYKLESLPSIAAAASVLSGAPAIVLMHLVFAPLWAILCVLAHGLLLRCLAPRHWPWLLVALEAALLTLGELHREWGNFSYLRMHQGKSMFLTFFFPCITLYGLKLGKKLELRTALLLCAAQIGALGMSSTAAWAAPVMGGTAVLSGMTGFHGHGKRLAVFLLTSCYVLGMAGLLYYTTLDSPLMHTMQSGNINDYTAKLIRLSLGWSPLAFLIWYVTLTAWTLCPTPLARRYALICPLIVFLVFLNPYLAPFVVKYVTSAILYWRILWLLPVPLFCAIALSSPVFFRRPLRFTGSYYLFPLAGILVASLAVPDFGADFLQGKTALAGRHGPTMAVIFLVLLAGLLLQERRTPTPDRATPRMFALFGGLLALFFFILPSHYLLSAENNVTIRKPGLKVPREEYLVSKWVAKRFGPQDRVLLPVMQSTWLPTFSNHPSPVIIVGYWDQLMRGLWTEPELQERIWLRDYVSGQLQKGDPNRFRQGLERYTPAAVSIKQAAPYIAATRKVLQSTGYTRAYEAFGSEVWIKKKRTVDFVRENGQTTGQEP